MKFFHRYESEIHGNYRKGYLRFGTITGVVLMLYIFVRYMMGVPAESPEAYITDGLLLVAVFLFTLLYRNVLPDRKATLKELMLLGLGIAVVASVLYGLFLWVFGSAVPEQTELFTRTLRGEEAFPTAPAHYWAAWWGIESAVKLSVLGGFGAFIAAIVFRNEKSAVHQKNNNNE